MRSGRSVPQIALRSVDYSSVPVLESSVMGGPEKIRSRGSWSHIVSKATDA